MSNALEDEPGTKMMANTGADQRQIPKASVAKIGGTDHPRAIDSVYLTSLAVLQPNNQLTTD